MQAAEILERETLKPSVPVHRIEKPVQAVRQEPLPVPETGAAPAETSGKVVRSPLPGVIVDVKVKVGDRVKVGDVVAVLEAMKMENEILSEWDGVVDSVDVKTGDSVLEGACIMKIG